MPFVGPSPSVISGKKSTAQKHILGDDPAFWIFFQDSRIRVNKYIFKIGEKGPKSVALAVFKIQAYIRQRNFGEL